VGRTDLLLAWAERHGIATFPVRGFRLASRWRQLAGHSGLGVYCEHPIDSEEDVATVERFVAAARKTSGALYYSPRPNHYQATEAATLIAAQPMHSVQPRVPALLQQSGKRLVRSYLSSTTRSRIRNLVNAVRARVAPKSPAPTAADGVLRPKLPSNLNGWSGSWCAWDADTDTLRRDLLDRIDRFFPTPGHLHVILLNKCNLRCVMCPYHSPKYTSQHTSGYFDARKAMDEVLFEQVATYAAKHAITMQFGQIEEVLLHPRIFDYIARAKALGVPRIHVTTNGTLLTPEKGARLAASGVDSVMFSIDAATAETYRKVRGRDLAELEANIAAFLPHAKRRGIAVTVSFILQNEASHEREAFLAKWRRLGVDHVTFYVLSAFDPLTGEVMRDGAIYEPGTRYPCASPWTQSVIFPDGEVSLCCKTMLDVGWRGVVSVGSLREHSMEEIWLGPAYRRVRAELIDNEFREFEVCRKCGIWSASSYFEERNEGYVRAYNETSETVTFTGA
jgi:MoaA/NifB/PqqE/SkfB family radical SAM enzyme